LRETFQSAVKADLKNAHQAALAKQDQMKKLKGALNITTADKDLGDAFDLEL